jgi:hypothetical protein
MSQKFNWRENEFFLETIEIGQQAWAAAKTASPLYGAIAGVALMFVFGVVLPLMLHIFFGDIEGVVGATLGFLSGLLGALFRIFGFVSGLICWGAAARNFAASRREPARARAPAQLASTPAEPAASQEQA